MVIDNGDPAFRKRIFKKFDIDDEGHISWEDFSATMATFVGDHTNEQSLQDLFEIYDLDQDGFLTVNKLLHFYIDTKSHHVGEHKESVECRHKSYAVDRRTRSHSTAF